MTPGKKNVGTNFPKPLFQSEEAIYMKIIFFYSHANRTHNKGFALGLVLKAESEFLGLENVPLSRDNLVIQFFFLALTRNKQLKQHRHKSLLLLLSLSTALSNTV